MVTEKNFEKVIDDYIIQQIYKKKKSVKIEIKKGKFKADDGKYYTCLIAIFDNKYIMEDFATECFEEQHFDKLKNKINKRRKTSSRRIKR